MSAERARRFPNPELAQRLVLYPAAGGGVALDWHLDPAVIEQSHSAFAAHQPVAKLYLRRAGGDGAHLAEAAIDLSSDLSGQAQFPEPLVGALQAELGLEGQRDGGWLLLARSNQLQAVPESLGLASLTPQSAGEPQAMQPPLGLTHQAQSPSPRPSTAAVTGVINGTTARLTTRFPDPSLAALADRPERRAGAFPLANAGGTHRFETHRLGQNTSSDAIPSAEPSAPSGDQPSNALSDDRMSDARSRVQADPEQVLLDQRLLRRQDVTTSAEPTGGSGERHAEQLGNQRAVVYAPRGSGPIAPYPTGEGAVVQGELHVFGRAAPGSLLDLGGHPFRVGPGGRFSFRVALDDPELLAALLARLPRLPVAEREP